MATLVRTTVAQELQPEDSRRSLQHDIPTPFPVERLVDLQDAGDDDILNELAAERIEYDRSEGINAPVGAATLEDVQFSIAAVQQSCLTTLSTLLSVPATALSSPMPCSSTLQSHSISCSGELDRSTMVAADTWSMADRLAVLVHTLRIRDSIFDTGLVQSQSGQTKVNEATLLSQLHDLVDTLAPSMHRRDSHLAQAIVALLIDLQQLSTSFLSASASSSCPPSSTQTPVSHLPSTSPLISAVDVDPHAVLTTLQRQLSSFQPNTTNLSSSSRTYAAPVHTVQMALLWARIDEQLEAVVTLCRGRASGGPTLTHSDSSNIFPDPTRLLPSMDPNPNAHAAPLFEEDHLPPRYECDYDGLLDDMPPAYAAELACANPRWSLSNEKDALLMSEYPPGKGSLTLPTSQRASDAEHNRTLDLDQVTRAIDRLYVVAPQLTSQRVELRREKIAQMQKAQHNKGKSRAVAAASDAELDKMLDLLGKASEREIVDQRVTIDPGRRIRKLDLEEQRYTYIEHIVRRSSAGRLHSQDAEQNYNVAKSAQTQTDTGLRESDTSEGEPAATLSMSSLTVPADKKSLSRSSSTPHLAWLKAAARDRSGTASSVKDAGSTLKSSSSSSMKRLSGKFGRKSRPSSSGSMIVSGFDEFRRGALDIVYVAEYHETLKHVLVFIALNGASSNKAGCLAETLTAEVLPSTSSGTSGDWLLLRLSGTPSPPLTLPASVIPGVKEALGRNTHWEVKLGCSAIQQSSSVTNNLNITLSEGDDPPLLTASQLTSLIPTSYTCRSCLLPLISSPPTQYRDLPSEYWEELVDAWMCHPEGQTIAKGRMQMHCEKSGRGFGFWPTEREALVGGSYVLFERNAAVEGNITEVTGSERDDNARLIRCICGAMIGRRHERNAEDGSTVRMYRLFKYAIRPVSLTAECPKIPMSAFIVRDMLEHVQAHATYRFVLSDEEEERPRLLVWLFKPSIRISYMLASPLLLPKANSVKASKVLYKILGPDSTTDIKGLLNKYPGFPQAEHLFYPMDVCRKLAALLSESTQAYPESLQMMTDLHVGWLCRG